jgi:hypothetical protein
MQLSIVDPPEGVKPGWDAADAVAEGLDVQALLAAARPVKPPGQAPALLTAAEILDEADAPGPEWVVEGLVPSGGVVLLVGRPKSGKSTLARALAVAVVQGRPFLGRETRRGPVLLLSLEDRQRDAARHLRALGLSAEDPLLLATGLRDMTLLRGWIQAHRPALVIIDTVGRVLRLRDSSGYAEVTAALDGLLRLARESGAALLLLHHSPKGSDGRDPTDAPLGSTAFAGTADVVLHLKRGRDGVRTLASVQRVGEDLEESVVVVGSDGWPALGGTRRDVQAESVKQVLLEALRAHGEATTRELLEAVEGEWRVKLRALQTLVEKGQVLREGTGKRGDPYRYLLAEPDNSLLRCARGLAQRNNETENRLGAASVLDESVAREFRNQWGLAQRIQPRREREPAPANPAEGTPGQPPGAPGPDALDLALGAYRAHVETCGACSWTEGPRCEEGHRLRRAHLQAWEEALNG